MMLQCVPLMVTVVIYSRSVGRTKPVAGIQECVLRWLWGHNQYYPYSRFCPKKWDKIEIALSKQSHQKILSQKMGQKIAFAVSRPLRPSNRLRPIKPCRVSKDECLPRSIPKLQNVNPIGHRAVDRSFRLHWLENDGILAKLWINLSIERPQTTVERSLTFIYSNRM